MFELVTRELDAACPITVACNILLPEVTMNGIGLFLLWLPLWTFILAIHSSSLLNVVATTRFTERLDMHELVPFPCLQEAIQVCLLLPSKAQHMVGN